MSHHKVWIVMGQGVYGSLVADKISICTGTLYTCSGITMFNNETKVGGLYHFPSGGLRDESSSEAVAASLRNMATNINPTSVEVVSAADPMGGLFLLGSGMGTPESDKKAITKFISQTIGKAVAFGAEGTWAGISNKGITCATDSDSDWPSGGTKHDLQATAAGTINLATGVNVTLVGASDEDDTVHAVW